jgi:hypothetical protein
VAWSLPGPSRTSCSAAVASARISPPDRRIARSGSALQADVTSVPMFHPGHGTWVVTIASASPARTTARLAGRYPRQLCVVRSRFSLAAVHAARAAVAALLTRSGHGRSRYGVTAVGVTASAAGQPVVLVDAVSAAAALRAALASQPVALIRIVPWLRPVSG